MKTMNFSKHVNEVFTAEKTSYEATRNLMFDLVSGAEIYDKNHNVVTKQAANDKLRTLLFQILELSENPTKRDIKRAMKKHHDDLYSIIEEVVDLQVETGFKDNEFFDTYVEYRNIARGDAYEFISPNKTILALAKVAGQHHNTVLQRLGEGEHFTVSMNTYRAAVGASIDRYLLGQEDWATLINKIAEAFQIEIRTEVYTQVMNSYTQIPAQDQFVGNGALTLSTKAAFDEIIENVETASNTGSIIIGTKTALKKLNGLSDVDWRADSQKESVAAIGRLGNYETSTLIEVPQRFANNDVTKKLINNKILLIMPSGVDNKFVYLVDQGETEIAEVPAEKNKNNGRIDDIMEYEVTRSFGVSTRIGRYYGAWILE